MYSGYFIIAGRYRRKWLVAVSLSSPVRECPSSWSSRGLKRSSVKFIITKSNMTYISIPEMEMIR
jgi:hypothetical protein